MYCLTCSLVYNYYYTWAIISKPRPPTKRPLRLSNNQLLHARVPGLLKVVLG